MKVGGAVDQWIYSIASTSDARKLGFFHGFYQRIYPIWHPASASDASKLGSFTAQFQDIYNFIQQSNVKPEME